MARQRHDSYAIVACVNVCSDVITKYGNKVQRSSIESELWGGICIADISDQASIKSNICLNNQIIYVYDLKDICLFPNENSYLS